MRTVEDRLELLEEAVSRLVTAPVAMEGPPSESAGVLVDRGAPGVGEATPVRWRGPSGGEHQRRWRDLFAWVEWMFEAFDVYVGRAENGLWWRSAGAVEELSALRDWHHELVDVTIAPALPSARTQHSRAGMIGFERRERAERCGQARDLVYWHDARVRVCERLLGPSTQPLLVRSAQVAPVSREHAEALRHQREEEFSRFLQQVVAPADDADHVEAAGNRPTPPLFDPWAEL